jgi:hypothetical protein
MRQRFRTRDWKGLVLVGAMVLATLAAGFCLLDGDEHGATSDDGASFDFCLGLAIMSVAVVVLTFISIYSVAADPPSMLHSVPLHLPDPPPKFSSLS